MWAIEFSIPRIVQALHSLLFLDICDSLQFIDGQTFFSDFSKLVQQRELLDGQLNENKSVLEELNLLKDDNQVSSRPSPSSSMEISTQID